MAIYHHVWTDYAAGWRQHGIEIEGAGWLFATIPQRLGSEEDQFTEGFLTRAVAESSGAILGRLACRYQVALTADRVQRQHFVCDHDGRPLLRTLYVEAGTERDRRTQEFLQQAVTALAGG